MSIDANVGLKRDDFASVVTPRVVPGAQSSGRFAFDTLMALVMIGLRMGLQAVVVVFIARLLGPAEFGAFNAIAALGAVLAPLSGFGIDFIAMRSVARSPSVSLLVFHRSLRRLLLTGFPLFVLVGSVGCFWLDGHATPAFVIAILFADVLMFRVSELVAKMYQGREQITEMGAMRLLPAVSRLIALGAAWALLGKPSALEWAYAYLGGAVLACVVSVAVALVSFRADRDSQDETSGTWADGLHFAGGVVSSRFFTEFDKTLVLALSGALGAGIYAAAYRMVEFTLMPVNAMLSVLYGRSFTETHHLGMRAAVRRRLRFMYACGAASVAVSATLWFCLVPFTVAVLGASFEQVADGRLPLALLPTAMCLRLTGEQALASVGLLGLRSFTQWPAAALAVLLNVLFIPAHGWVAAAWVTLCAEGLLAAVYSGALLRAERRLCTL